MERHNEPAGTELTSAARDQTDRPLVADDVIATYAADATRSVAGIVELHGSTWQELSEKVHLDVPNKGALVRWAGPGRVTIDVHVKVAWGVAIPELAGRVQETLSKKIESLLDIAVEGVTLFVDEIESPAPDDERG